MGRKTVDEFKKAFQAIKKPGRPKNVKGKIKDELEEAVLDEDSTTFLSKIDEIENLDHDYLVELVAYKIGKHWEDGSKGDFWHDKLSPALVTEAMALLIPDDMSDEMMQRVAAKSIDSRDYDRLRLFFERDPTGMNTYIQNLEDGVCKELLDDALSDKNSFVFNAVVKALHLRDGDDMLRFLVDEKEKCAAKRLELSQLQSDIRDRKLPKKLEELGELEKEQIAMEGLLAGALRHTLGPENIKLTGEFLLRDDKPGIASKFEGLMGFLKGGQQLIPVVLTAPEVFIEKVLPGLSTQNLFAYLSDPELRAALEDACEDTWNEFADKVPFLKVYKKVEASRKKDKVVGDRKEEQAKNIQAIFDCVMDGDEIVAAYVGTKTAPPSEIAAKIGPVDPSNPPRTDCHNMMTVVNEIVKGYPGMKPGLGDQMGWGACPNMLMTKELNKIGKMGRGLIDKNFSGNVFDDNGAPTRRILFTGENGVNSHSWIKVDGKAYDSVLGISGTEAEIKEMSEFATFDWAVNGLIGKSSGGWYFIKDDPSIIKPEKPRLAVAPNPMSFTTAYYLTKTPALHLTDEALQKLPG